MERIIFAFTILLTLQSQAHAHLVSRYFRKVPVDQAHVISGEANDRYLNPESIKVLVWNIKKTQEVAWKDEFRSFAKNKELFLIQEAYPNELFLTTLAELGNYRWDMGISFTYRLYNNLPTGTMIGSRVYPTLAFVKHTPDLEPITETPKAMTLAKYPVLGLEHELLVINIHGINFTSFSSFKRNIAQAEEEISKHEGPVIIAGDFNTRTKTRLYHLFSKMKALGLSEINFKNGDQRMVAVMTNNILDHGFVRGLTVKDAEVFGSARGSDHKPMVIEVAVQN